MNKLLRNKIDLQNQILMRLPVYFRDIHKSKYKQTNLKIMIFDDYLTFCYYNYLISTVFAINY